MLLWMKSKIEERHNKPETTTKGAKKKKAANTLKTKPNRKQRPSNSTQRPRRHQFE